MTIGLEKARGLGTPRTSAERVAAHYGIGIDEAERWLAIHPESELLPARGAGLTRGTAAGVGNQSNSTGIILLGGLAVAMVIGLLGLLALSSGSKKGGVP